MDEKIPDLDSLFVEKSPEELEAILKGEDYDEEDSEEEDDELDYDSMTLEDLKYLCKERGIRVGAGAKRGRLVQLLTAYDEEEETEDEEDEAPVKNSRKSSKRQASNEDSEEEDSEEEDDENDDLIKNVRRNIRSKAGKK